jgi:translation initiation factor IF-3
LQATAVAARRLAAKERRPQARADVLSLTCPAKLPIFCQCRVRRGKCFIAIRGGQLVATIEEKSVIRRPIRTAQPAPKEGPRVNEEIRVREVQLIDKDGNNKGPTEISAALAMAQEVGLDLVEIAPNSSPPVCKILDYGKYKYQSQKKAAEARKKQKVVEIKEIKLRPMIDDHDYDVKMRSVQRFFEEGDKVKVTLRFRGREMAHQELGYKLLDRVKADTAKIAKIEQEPRFEGRQVVMVLAPR